MNSWALQQSATTTCGCCLTVRHSLYAPALEHQTDLNRLNLSVCCPPFTCAMGRRRFTGSTRPTCAACRTCCAALLLWPPWVTVLPSGWTAGSVGAAGAPALPCPSWSGQASSRVHLLHAPWPDELRLSSSHLCASTTSWTVHCMSGLPTPCDISSPQPAMHHAPSITMADTR